MNIPLYARLVGYRTLRVPTPHIAAFLDLCRRHGFVYYGYREGEEHTAFCLPAATARPTGGAVTRAAAAAGIPLTLGPLQGMPSLFLRLLRRPGLVVGVILAMWLYFAASGVVWDIRISGNEGVSDRSLTDSLAACGLSVGTPLRGFRADVLANRVLMYDDRLAWLSINRRGTVAYVEVREKEKPQEAPSEDGPADIVAAVGGIITRVEILAGNVRVRAGQTVGVGDVLVSGLYDSLVEGIRYVRANARVYAKTTREITVTIPCSYEQKVYLDRETDGGAFSGFFEEKYLNFFGKRIKFSKKTGNTGGICDTIEGEQSLGLVQGVGFPISVSTVWHLPYEMRTCTRTPAEAEALAYVELSRRIAALPGGAELLSKTIKTYAGDEVFVLTCTLVCVEDIGRVREIERG